jgi:hypothetical protein
MKRPPQITNEEEWRKSCSEIVRICKGLLDATVGVVAGARDLGALRWQVAGDKDPDFTTFVGIDSSTDRFPPGHVRDHWSPEALTRYDEERRREEDHWRPYAEKAARNLIAKYGESIWPPT